MTFVNEYALLFAVAAPVVAIAGMNAFLWLGGERGTLLLPGANRYPAIEFGMVTAEAAKSTKMPASSSAAAFARSSNDEMELEAA